MLMRVKTKKFHSLSFRIDDEELEELKFLRNYIFSKMKKSKKDTRLKDINFSLVMRVLITDTYYRYKDRENARAKVVKNGSV
jgi:hypothetical protein